MLSALMCHVLPEVPDHLHYQLAGRRMAEVVLGLHAQPVAVREPLAPEAIDSS